MNTWITLLLLATISFSAKFNDDGEVAINRTLSRPNHEHFNRGLLLLHNFEYRDAAEEFRKEQALDPTFALAYWGEAMTYDHPIWRELDLEGARSVLNKLGNDAEQRVAKGATAMEEDLIRSVEILFGTGTRPEREKRYSEFLKQVSEKYSDNDDVAAFYALSLLALKRGWSEWEHYNIEAAEIANKILRSNPDHAGALHYLVHADDHPNYAKEGLDAANRYGKVASYAGHALHMPSHIYLALGMWDEVVASNEVSWKAGVDRKNDKHLNNDQLNYHAHLWLTYGYLQQGRFNKAMELITNQAKYVEELSSSRARFHLMQMKGHYLFQTAEWNSPLADMGIKTDDMDVHSRFTSFFLDGYTYFIRKNSAALRTVIDNLDKELGTMAKIQKQNDGIAVCSSTRYAKALPTSDDLRTGNRYLNELQGLLAWLKRDDKNAEKHFVAALPKEGSVVVGPPDFLISPYELYGQFLLDTKRPKDALTYFDRALAASPNRLSSLKGKLKAAQDISDTVLQDAVKKQLLNNLKFADPAARQGL